MTKPASAAQGHAIDERNLAALPSATGVYLFMADADDRGLPLYIGKSVNIRARVLAHLRDPAEARMMAQVRHVQWHRTVGEIGALLLEPRLIKARQPLYNILVKPLLSGEHEVVDLDGSNRSRLWAMTAFTPPWPRHDHHPTLARTP